MKEINNDCSHSGMLWERKDTALWSEIATTAAKNKQMGFGSKKRGGKGIWLALFCEIFHDSRSFLVFGQEKVYQDFKFPENSFRLEQK